MQPTGNLHPSSVTAPLGVDGHQHISGEHLRACGTCWDAIAEIVQEVQGAKLPALKAPAKKAKKGKR